MNLEKEVKLPISLNTFFSANSTNIFRNPDPAYHQVVENPCGVYKRLGGGADAAKVGWT
ncbi:predicted protein [Sclerotinia sclerotiorum 1980 UF-70]|uniref:Uncharacterized protein n=1 Tax=Sclerotinia sclerotiorum (strain ATCC 18683 / 1980 / Ss-1) TaxID=665079 RepID=A7EWW5_SCLS1|nr:predicted protein [Sclerotinia sclerotiorum 1980 UF-70]EDN93957.1 predicted protein [Sclerotinia sclerotiorum 1980 UF-70]